MKSTVLLAAPFALLALSAPAAVLMNEPFSDADYAAGTVKSNMSKSGTTDTAGFTADRTWQASNTGVVYFHADGLDFGRWMPGFSGKGLSAGWKAAATGNGDGARGVYRQLADGVMPRSGTFYFRCLAMEPVGAKWMSEWHRRVGFQQSGFNGDGGNDYWSLGYSGFPSTGPHFVFNYKSETESELLFRYGDCQQTLVDTVVQGTTYICLAKIEIQGLENGHDRISALAVPVNAWEWSGRNEPAWTFTDGDPGKTLATTQYYPDKFQLYGAYKTGNVAVAFDEVMLATEITDVVGPSLPSGTLILVRWFCRK